MRFVVPILWCSEQRDGHMALGFDVRSCKLDSWSCPLTPSTDRHHQTALNLSSFGKLVNINCSLVDVDSGPNGHVGLGLGECQRSEPLQIHDF